MLAVKRSIALFVFVLALGLQANAQLGISWTPGPSLLTPRESGGAVVDGSGNIFVLGGTSAQPLSVDRLAFGASAFTAAPPLPEARIAPGVVMSPNGQIFVLGGKIGTRAAKETLFYDPATGVATNQASMRTLRYRFAATVSGGNVYAIGGLTSTETPTSAFEVYSLGLGRWTLLNPLPEPRSNFAATTDYAGNILTFGGSIAGSAATTTVNKYSPSTATWTTLAPMPVATRDSAVVTGANNLLYVIGGSSATGVLDTVQIYDMVHDSWRLGTPLPLGLSNANVVIDRFGNLVVLGGLDASGQNEAVTWQSPQADAPPVIYSSPGGYVVSGQQFSYLVAANGSPAPTYSLVSGPNGVTVAPNGVLLWTPDLTQVGQNSITVRATNSSGSADQTFTVGVAPPAPTGLINGKVGANSTKLGWNPLPPEAGIATYNVYQRVCGGRNGCRLAQTQSGLQVPRATLAGLAAGTAYSFAVTAVVNGVESPASALVSFTTLRPSPATDVVVTNLTQNSVSLSWRAPVDSQVPIVMYRIVELGVVVLDNLRGTSATITGLAANSTHQYYVVALDAAFNQSIFAAAPGITTSSLPVLFHRPAFPRPTNYGGGYFPETLSAVNGGQLTLVTADGHSTAPVDYVVSSTGLPAATFSMVSGPAGMTIDPVTGVVSWNNVNSPTGTFSATVRGTNVAGATDFTFSYTVYAAGTDLLSPTEPTYFLTTATNVTRTSATISWAPSTDNVGVVGYRVFMSSPPPPCGGRGINTCQPPPTNIKPAAVVDGATTSVEITGLTPGSRYGMWIQAFDAAGNTSFVTAAVRPTFVTLP